MNLCNPSTVKELLARHGFRFSKSMGQNFLIDESVPIRIAEQSGIGRDSGVLEIGPGIGPLTVQLAERAGKVVCVELDKSLLPVLAETVADFDNVEVINGDILKTDLAEIADGALGGLRPVVCANLPYNITSPVLTALIDSKRFESITVMVQREVARRICADAGTSDYGAFSVYCGFYTQAELLFDVAPDCFMPAPKVWSSVITLRMREVNPCGVEDERAFFRVVKAAFAQRRKTLVNSLMTSFGGMLTKQEMTEIVTKCGFDERIRGETLDIAGFAKLADSIYGYHK